MVFIFAQRPRIRSPAFCFWRRFLCTDSLQLRILLNTESWRRFPNVSYAGYSGPWTEDAYFNYWLDRGPPSQLRPGERRVYLPIFWTACHLHCNETLKNELKNFIATLPRHRSYYTVITLALAFSHPALNIDT